MDGQSSAEIPKYVSHKEVWALKIKKVAENYNGSLDLFFEEPFAPINMEEGELTGRPNPAEGWYYVVYKDGYKSFSPAEAFEGGYTRV